MENRLKVLGSWAGLIGASVMSIGLIIVAFAFVGLEGQSYSPANHFVSELGHTAASELWQVFSLVLIIGASAFGLHMLSVGLRFRAFWRWLFIIGGLIVTIGGIGVALFPMDVNLDMHGLVALLFFFSSMILVTVFSAYVALSSQAAYPRWIALVGVPLVISSAVFLINLFAKLGESSDALAAPEARAATDIVTISEWGVIIFLSMWVIVLAIRDLARRDAQTAHSN